MFNIADLDEFAAINLVMGQKTNQLRFSG